MDHDIYYPHGTGIIVFDNIKQFARPVLVNEFDRNSLVVVPFSQKVVGFLKSSTASRIMMNDMGIWEEESCEDYFGFLSSPVPFIGIKPADSLIRYTTTKISLDYYIPTLERMSYSKIPKDWYDIGVGAPLPNTPELIRDWYLKPIEERLDNDAGQPQSLEQTFVETVNIDSNMNVNEQLTRYEDACIRLAKLFPCRQIGPRYTHLLMKVKERISDRQHS